jgi:Fic family protein
MKIPEHPPTLSDILTELNDPDRARRFANILSRGIISPAPDGKYRHWETLKYLPPPEDLTPQEFWASVKFARSQMRREVPLRTPQGHPFCYMIADPVLEMLHAIDRDASGHVSASEQITNPHTKERYVQSSLVEEAITSSQLEGASTTRKVAKEMIRSGREPLDRSERMILNNYRAIQLISHLKNKPLTPELIFTLHRTITEGTLSEGTERDYLRTLDDKIAVYDDRDNVVLHVPPPADQIPQRMALMCQFANEEQTGAFLHPVLKAIILHFWLAYDHPFSDGNGRTARALFYWSVLSQGFWLFEFVSISSIIHKAPVRYARSFLYTETDENDLTYFILSQLTVIQRGIKELYSYLERKMEEIRGTEILLRSSVFNHRQLTLLGHALRHPGMGYTIESHKISHGVSYQTARTDLLGLARKRMLRKTKRGHTFLFSVPADISDRLAALS